MPFQLGANQPISASGCSKCDNFDTERHRAGIVVTAPASFANRNSMKTLTVCMVLTAGVLIEEGLASSNDVTFTASRKRLDHSKERSGGNKLVEEKEIVYTVKATSKSFRDLTDVVIKYNVLYEEEEHGSTEKPKVSQLSGQKVLPSMLTNKPVEFDTDPITLSEAKLASNWHFTSGASRKAKDRVVGLWFRAYDSEGNLIGEHSNPSTVRSKYSWKEPS